MLALFINNFCANSERFGFIIKNNTVKICYSIVPSRKINITSHYLKI